MNNQFSQRVSDIIVYSKEEANRLRSRYIGPEHLLLGILRDGEGKAIEILSKLNTNLAAIKQQIRNPCAYRMSTVYRPIVKKVSAAGEKNVKIGRASCRERVYVLV